MAMFAKRWCFPLIATVGLLMMAGCNDARDTEAPLGAEAMAVGGLTQQGAPALPDLQLATLHNRPISLRSYAGQPVVLNLWATWCPPCRREMPVLEQAQAAFPDVAFVLVNQGESAQQAQAFLESEGLALTNVLFDPSSETMQALRTGGLPTTFFFDAQGRLVDLHLGEITMVDLEDKISDRF